MERIVSLGNSGDESDVLEAEWQALLQTVEGKKGGATPSKLVWRTSCVPIKPASKLEIPVEVAEANSELEYFFGTNDYDIAFSVTFVNGAGQATEVIPPTRCDSHLEPIRGAHRVHEVGTVILCWDNSYSWIVAKELQYSVSLARPGPKAAQATRSQRAAQALKDTRDQLEGFERRRVELDGAVEEEGERLRELQSELERLTAAVEETTTQLAAKEDERARLQVRIPRLHEFVRALGMRCPTPENFASIFAFGAKEDRLTWGLVCRDWLGHISAEELERLDAAAAQLELEEGQSDGESAEAVAAEAKQED